MKALPLFLLIAGATTLQAQTKPHVIARDAHSRTWQWETVVNRPDGQAAVEKHGYVEVGTGICRREGDRWVDASEVVEAFPKGAIGRSASMQVIFAPHLNTYGAIDTLAPDGNRVQSHILGLAFNDLAAQKSVMIAEVKDSLGEVTQPNRVLYRDAFDGNVSADVIYTYKLGSFHQDVVLRAQLPVTPADFGLDPDTTVLEVWTEMIPSVEPRRQVLPAVAVLQTRNNPAAPALELTDEVIDFGSTHLAPGRAFGTDGRAAADPFADDALVVAKSWVTTDAGRKCLVEMVPYVPLADQLVRTLPQAKAAPAIQRAAVRKGRAFPSAPQQARGDRPARPMQMAARSGEPGFSIDYEQVANGTGWIAKGDTTYYVASTFYLTNVVIEGNSVVKAAPGTGVRLRIQGPLDCQTSLYRPAIFTAKDDDSVGEPINGSSGIVTNNTYYGQYLEFYGDTNSPDLHDLQIRHAYYGVNLSTFFTNRECLVRNAQFTSNYAAIVYGVTNRLRNVLVADGRYTMGGGSRIEAEHLTAHRMTYLRSSGTAYVTNSLLVAVTNSSISGLSNAVLSSDAGVFQTVGAGGHYLADGSPYRDSGTTTISPWMQTELSRLTTYPPQVLTNVITTNTVLTPTVGRDTNAPDLGYHYAAVDFAMNSVVVTNQASVTIEPGVAIAAFGEAAFCLTNCAELICEGDPLNRIQFTRFDAVQEMGLPWGGGSSFRFFRPDHGQNDPASLRLRFVDFHLRPMPYTSHHLYSGSDSGPGCDLASSSVRDCAFHGGKIDLESSTTAWGFTNNLIDRVWWIGFDALEFWFFNNFLRGGTLDLWGGVTATNWTFRDNVFCEATLTGTDGHYDHNAYIDQTTFLTTDGTDKILTNFVFELGPLGRYYQPTNSALTNAGSRGADAAGLCHFTAVIDQAKEGTSTVDIGLHYVAVTNIAGVWQPIDSDNDGLPDYYEDSNGDGVFSPSPSETDWQSFTSITNGQTGLQIFTPLR